MSRIKQAKLGGEHLHFDKSFDQSAWSSVMVVNLVRVVKMVTDLTIESAIHWHFWRNRLFLLTKNALLKRGPKKSGMGRPPPIIRAMPERKRLFSVDPFPKHLKVREFFLPKVDTQIHWWLLSHNESFSSFLNVLILDPLVSIVTANAQQGLRISVGLEKKMQEQGKSQLAVMGLSVWRKTGCFSKITRNNVTPLESRVL